MRFITPGPGVAGSAHSGAEAEPWQNNELQQQPDSSGRNQYDQVFHLLYKPLFWCRHIMWRLSFHWQISGLPGGSAARHVDHIAKTRSL